MIDLSQPSPFPYVPSETTSTGGEWINTEDAWEIALLRCPECGQLRKMTIFKGVPIRNTWCWLCKKAVSWQRVDQ